MTRMLEITTPSPERGKRIVLEPIIALMGTCGEPAQEQEDPAYAWRREYFLGLIQGVAKKFGVAPATLSFDPRVPTIEWNDAAAEREAQVMASALVIAAPVLNITKGPAAIAESGLGALGAFLRGQYYGTVIEMPPGKSFADSTFRARYLVQVIARETRSIYPHFTIEPDLAALARWSASRLEEGLEQQKQGSPAPEPVVRRSSLEASAARSIIGVFGSADQSATAPREKMKQAIRAAGLEFFDPVRADWAEPEKLQEEFQHKLTDQVLLLSITSPSIGSGAECGWLILHAYLTGRKVGVFIGDHPDDKKGDAGAFRVKKLIRKHLERLFQDFPYLRDTVYLASSPEDLTQWGIQQMNT